ncbi:unnamed protein product [Ambrosiozyma monospora]|uniref:Unnamed protein product n=1 Tax=Ambrosiozyma monospora TaxID=43982 RepID=A0A9W7DHA2_AMBMO|nr:unnamed protein product [Ambrosiozyma monospora]
MSSIWVLLLFILSTVYCFPSRSSEFIPSITANQGGGMHDSSDRDFHFMISLPLGLPSLPQIPTFSIRSLNPLTNFIPSGILVALEEGEYFVDVTDNDARVRVTDDEFRVLYEGRNEGYSNICVYFFAETLDELRGGRSRDYDAAFEVRIPRASPGAYGGDNSDLVFILRGTAHVVGRGSGRRGSSRYYATALPAFRMASASVSASAALSTATPTSIGLPNTVTIENTDISTATYNTFISSHLLATPTTPIFETPVVDFDLDINVEVLPLTPSSLLHLEPAFAVVKQLDSF